MIALNPVSTTVPGVPFLLRSVPQPLPFVQFVQFDSLDVTCAVKSSSDYFKDEYLTEHYEYQTDTSCSDKINDRLRSHEQLWEEIGTHDDILDIILNGYKIPFHCFPSRCIQRIIKIHLYSMTTLLKRSLQNC